MAVEEGAIVWAKFGQKKGQHDVGLFNILLC